MSENLDMPLSPVGPVMAGPEGFLPPTPMDRDMAQWGGSLVLVPPVEPDWTAMDKTEAELSVPPVLGDVMQFTRVMQMAVLSAVFSLDMKPSEHQPMELAVMVRGAEDQRPQPWQPPAVSLN